MAWNSQYDPYLDPQTEVLKNKVGATTFQDLAQVEADLVTVQTFELLENPPKPSSDFDELAAIHKHLFQDIYAWAGAFRTVNIRKNVDGADAFAHHGKLQLNVQHAEPQLRQDAFLQGLNRAQIVV